MGRPYIFLDFYFYRGGGAPMGFEKPKKVQLWENVVMLKSGIYFTPETVYLLENIKKIIFQSWPKNSSFNVKANILYLFNISDDIVEYRHWTEKDVDL